MPAPPARSFSASVPCGVSCSASSPASTWRSNSLFSPTYEAITFFTCRPLSSRPMPKSSTPALLPTMVRPLMPLSTSAWIRFSGIPHSPKPPAAIVMSSRSKPDSASRAFANTLFMLVVPFRLEDGNDASFGRDPGARPLHRLAQHVEVADVIREEQDEPCVHPLALRRIEVAVGLDQRLVEIVGQRQIGFDVERRHGSPQPLQVARAIACASAPASKRRQRAQTCWSGRKR